MVDNEWSLEKACEEANERLEKSWIERLDRNEAERSWFFMDAVDSDTGETIQVERIPGEWDRYAKQSTRPEINP